MNYMTGINDSCPHMLHVMYITDESCFFCGCDSLSSASFWRFLLGCHPLIRGCLINFNWIPAILSDFFPQVRPGLISLSWWMWGGSKLWQNFIETLFDADILWYYHGMQRKVPKVWNSWNENEESNLGCWLILEENGIGFLLVYWIAIKNDKGMVANITEISQIVIGIIFVIMAILLSNKNRGHALLLSNSYPQWNCCAWKPIQQ